MAEYGLRDKVVLITGANHGIGAATALAFAAEGAKLFLTYYHVPHNYSDPELADALQAQEGGMALYTAYQQQPIEMVIEQIRATGGEVIGQAIDLGQVEAIGALFDACEAHFGRVDILVANHTHDKLETFDPARVSADVAELTAGSIDRHFAVNTRAVALLMHTYLKRYLARDGDSGVIITLTTDTRHGHAENISYSASKAALENYSTAAAAEMGRYGIRVNVVAPGPTQTGYITPEAETAIVAHTPLGRLGRAEDIADVIVFLASDRADWISGQIISVTGGFSWG